jgi:hypothetical protein
MDSLTDLNALLILTRVIEDLKFKKEDELAEDLIRLRDMWLIPKIQK